MIEEATTKALAATSTPYTRRERVRAINSAAVIGWAYFAAKYLIEYGNYGGLPFFAIYGIPVALAVTWIIAGPILLWLVRGPVSWLAAICWGAVIAGLMATIGFSIHALLRWNASANPNFHYQSGGGDFIRDVDGVLTPYGWSMQIEGAVEFTIVGTIVALVVRAIIGRGKEAALAR
jgi:hypothetical protein